MLELSSHEVVCPVCNKSFFPETRAGRKVLCGEKLSSPENKRYNSSECRPHFFCSKECVKQFEENHVEEPKVGRIRMFLEKLGNVSYQPGINKHASYRILNKMKGN